MQAREMAEQYPVVPLERDALDATRLLAEHRLPGLVVTDGAGHPRSVLDSSQVVRFLVPVYVQQDSSLAAVIDEPLADRAADKLRGRTVRELIQDGSTEIAVADAADTILEVAAEMARMHCSLVAVLDGSEMVGVVTASRLLEFALAGR